MIKFVVLNICQEHCRNQINKLRLMKLNKLSVFVEIASSHIRKIVQFNVKNMTNSTNFNSFLDLKKSELVKKPRYSVIIHPITNKYL